MAIAGQYAVQEGMRTIPATMQAAVYRGVNDVRLETVPVPQIGPGELLLRVHSCGVCGTDLKKIATGSHSAPRIFGHETSGVVAAVGAGVREFQPGDRVVVFHHMPRLLLLPAQYLRSVFHIQESRLHRRVRALGRRFR
jgi:L-iditol 2-dehydrogenase